MISRRKDALTEPCKMFIVQYVQYVQYDPYDIPYCRVRSAGDRAIFFAFFPLFIQASILNLAHCLLWGAIEVSKESKGTTNNAYYSKDLFFYCTQKIADKNVELHASMFSSHLLFPLYSFCIGTCVFIIT